MCDGVNVPQNLRHEFMKRQLQRIRPFLIFVWFYSADAALKLINECVGL